MRAAEVCKVIRMRSTLFPWLSGLVVMLSGALVLSLPLSFEIKLVVACLTVFLTDALGGRWFGYASLLMLFVGLVTDRSGQWALMLPLLIGSCIAALLVRHTERSWFGVLLSIAAFMVPAVALGVIRPRFDPALEVPLGSRYVILHGLASSFAILISSLLTWQQLSPGRQAVKPTPVRKSSGRATS
jgi:hypothetical protein